MLRELNVVEQRYRAVVEVLSGTPVIEVAKRYGVARQTVHRWIAQYRAEGLDGLADRLAPCSRRQPVPGAASAAGAAQYDPVWIRYPKYLPVTGRIGSPVNP
jgi:transposase-like protein